MRNTVSAGITEGLGFGVVAILTAQVTALQKDGRARAWTVYQGKRDDVVNGYMCAHSFLPLFLSKKAPDVSITSGAHSIAVCYLSPKTYLAVCQVIGTPVTLTVVGGVSKNCLTLCKFFHLGALDQKAGNAH